MTPEEKLAGEAVKYSMPAIEDYMATRCLLLSGLFVGLTLAHEATEKIMKSLLIIEKTAFPKSCHDLTTLAELLIKKDAGRYGFLNKEKKFLERLDKHYGWRYHDGDITKRSKTKSASELHPVDNLWMLLYERYLGVLPDRKQSTDLLSGLLQRNKAKIRTICQSKNCPRKQKLGPTSRLFLLIRNGRRS